MIAYGANAGHSNPPLPVPVLPRMCTFLHLGNEGLGSSGCRWVKITSGPQQVKISSMRCQAKNPFHYWERAYEQRTGWTGSQGQKLLAKTPRPSEWLPRAARQGGDPSSCALENFFKRCVEESQLRCACDPLLLCASASCTTAGGTGRHQTAGNPPFVTIRVCQFGLEPKWTNHMLNK